jgi:hypothetical protein
VSAQASSSARTCPRVAFGVSPCSAAPSTLVILLSARCSSAWY